MTPEQRIMREILLNAAASPYGNNIELTELDASNIDAVYDELRDMHSEICDEEMEFRGGGVVTDIVPKQNNYFAGESHAIQLQDGGWVGWTFYYGGGKHDEPDAEDWMPDAYELSMTEETKVVQIFKKVVV